MDRNGLDKRSSEILRCVVDFYLETGEPIGSQSIYEKYDVSLSPATIRGVMSDLENAGFLFSTHTSSGRAPTSIGINIFVNELKDRDVSFDINKDVTDDKNKAEVAVEKLSDTTNSLGLLMVDKKEVSIEYIELKKVSTNKCVFILALSDGTVKTDVFSVSEDVCEYDIELADFILNEICIKREDSVCSNAMFDNLVMPSTINDEVFFIIEKVLSSEIIKKDGKCFIVKGQTNLFDDVKSIEQFNTYKKVIDLVKQKELFDSLFESIKESRTSQVINCEDIGVPDSCGCSFAVSPCFINGKVMGIVGIVGHMRRNYKRVVPTVESAAKIISEVI